MMQINDIKWMRSLFVIIWMMRKYDKGYVKVLGEGDHTALSTRIHREESRKILSTNIVSYFAGTVEGAWFYVLAKPIRVVLIYSMLIPYRCNHYVDQSKFSSNKTWRRLHMSQQNWNFLEFQFGSDGKFCIIRCNRLCIYYFIEVLQDISSKSHDNTSNTDNPKKSALPRL